jgi:small conductance mechanosensitive channel
MKRYRFTHPLLLTNKVVEMRSQFLAMVATQTAFGIAGSIVLATSVVSPALAQLPSIPHLQMSPPSPLSKDLDSQVVTTWIRLDGRRLFKIAAPRADVSERVEDIQQRLRHISQNYFQSASKDLQVQIKTENNLPVIYVNNQSLLTVTRQDAKLQEEDPLKLAQSLSKSLQEDLKRAKQERQLLFLRRQAGIASGVFLIVILSSWGVRRWHLHSKLQPMPASSPPADPVTTQLSQQQQQNLQEVRQRLSQMAQGIVWGSGTLIILGLFPYTRMIQVWILTVLEVPLGLGIVGLGTYVAIRLSYVLIDRFTAALANNALLTPEDSLRLQLRVSTISRVSKGIATFSGVAIGTIISLTTLGINIGPLLAGAGLIGVAVSLASQNLIKDAINGFLIILEDQYALGDVIAVGDVAGLVENLNLRITQLRDAEGRLITIPNSEIKIVANLSSRWSRADLSIPVAYQADIDQALKLIETVALDIDKDPQWQEQILETPQVLGVENFGDRGLMIRVWIKTQPLKQWDVAREYRRRLKIAFDQAGIAIPFPQQAIWLNEAQSLRAQSDGSSTSN